jgi:hypothetical protein
LTKSGTSRGVCYLHLGVHLNTVCESQLSFRPSSGSRYFFDNFRAEAAQNLAESMGSAAPDRKKQGWILEQN